MEQKKTNVYVDGFNLYYRALFGTKYKWLDIKKLCSFYFKKFDIYEIKYFTAKVKTKPSDLRQPVRQQIYLRALKTIPRLEIIYGTFSKKKARMPLAPGVFDRKKKKVVTQRIDVKLFGIKIKLPIFTTKNKPQCAFVYKSEEKGSDVNLATALLKDAYEGNFDAAIVLSNDYDLKRAIETVVKDLKLPVFVLNPSKNSKRVLRNVSTYTKTITKGSLENSQFPNELEDENGTITKPDTW